MLPRSVAEHYRDQQRLALQTLTGTRRAWRRMSGDFDSSWRLVGPRLVLLVSAAQLSAARAGAAYVPEALAELDIDANPAGEVQSRSLAGVASDGRELESLLFGAVVQAKENVAGQRVRDGRVQTFSPMSAPAALAEARKWLDVAVHTQVADAARVAAGVAITARPQVSGWVRMLNPPSCSRCVVLAGRRYRWSDGFQRHPGCDCRHVPASEDVASDITTDPHTYFDSLSAGEQDKTFTKAGARAIRDGADIGQVVNARRGMSTTVGPSGRRRLVRQDVFGRQVFTTNEGVTRRGVAGRAQMDRRGRAGAPRLMPESIYEVANDRDDAIRLLKAHGYIK